MRPHLPILHLLDRALLVLLTVVVATTVAHADEAQDAFNEGMKLLGQGKYDAACEAFERSETASGGESVRTRYQLGRCNEERGKAVVAHRAFLDAARLSAAEGDAKRAEVARQRAAELEPKVALLVIDVPAGQRVEGLSIRRDGDEVRAHDWGTAVAVEPGVHEVVVAAPAQEALTLKVSAELGKKAQLTVPPFGTPAATGGGVVTPPAGEGEDEDEPEGGGTRFKSPALFWTGVGLGAAGLLAAAGGTAAWYTLNTRDHFQSEPPAAAIAAYAASVVFLGVGIPFMVVGGRRVPDEPEPAEEGLRIQPWVGPLGGGVLGRF